MKRKAFPFWLFKFWSIFDFVATIYDIYLLYHRCHHITQILSCEYLTERDSNSIGAKTGAKSRRVLSLEEGQGFSAKGIAQC